MSVKDTVGELLRRRDFRSLVEICQTDRKCLQEVRYRLYDLDEALRWSAIETIARLMKKWWDEGQEEKVRVYIRTLFWSLNDESGGIGWSSAQTIAEIIARNPLLADPYGSMMIAYCIDEPPLLKGCLWGIGRLGGLMRKAVMPFKDEILEVFAVDDIGVLGTAAWAVGESGSSFAMPALKRLLGRSEPVTVYVEGTFLEKPLGIWAEEAVNKINALDY